LAKLLLLVAVVAIVYVLLKNYKRAIARQQEGAPPAKQAGTGGEDMVRCAHCGVHLPKSESFLSQGEHFCSDEHRKLGSSRRD
jgi:uncharacterized protein